VCIIQIVTAGVEINIGNCFPNWGETIFNIDRWRQSLFVCISQINGICRCNYYRGEKGKTCRIVFYYSCRSCSEYYYTAPRYRVYSLWRYNAAQRWNRVSGSPGHRVSDFGRVGSGHGSVCQIRCLTRFWVLTCAFIVALFLQSNTISPN